MLTRPDGDPARPTTVAPGRYRVSAGEPPEPRTPNPEPRTAEPYLSGVVGSRTSLSLDADSGYGLRRDDLIAKDGDPAKVAARLAEYQQWRTERDEAAAGHACRRCRSAPRRRSRSIAHSTG